MNSDWNHEPFISVVARNVDPSTTARELSDFLWAVIGLNIPSNQIKLIPVEKSYQVAVIRMTSNSLVDLLNRNLSEQHIAGRLLTFEHKKIKANPERRPRDNSHVEYRQQNHNGIPVLK